MPPPLLLLLLLLEKSPAALLLAPCTFFVWGKARREFLSSANNAITDFILGAANHEALHCPEFVGQLKQQARAPGCAASASSGAGTRRKAPSPLLLRHAPQGPAAPGKLSTAACGKRNAACKMESHKLRQSVNLLKATPDEPQRRFLSSARPKRQVARGASPAVAVGGGAQTRHVRARGQRRPPTVQ